MSENLKLGQIITDEQHKDAIHIAVAPVRAAEKLKAGQHVSLVGVEAWATVGDPIGVVDPFLKTDVKKGQMFWLYLYPGSIRSLRHEWTHPAFGSSDAPASDPKSASEKWMRAWAVRHVSEDYYGNGSPKSEQAAYEYAIRAGYEMHIGPYESARDYIDNEWWAHWEAITGKAGQRGEYFSCAC